MDPTTPFGMTFPFAFPLNMALPQMPFVPIAPMQALPWSSFAQPSMMPIVAPGFASQETIAQMQTAMLQNQKQQLGQLKNYLVEYTKSVDEALAKVEEELAKAAKPEGKK